MFGIFETRYSPTTRLFIQISLFLLFRLPLWRRRRGRKEGDGVERLINNRDSGQIVFCANNTNRIVHENFWILPRRLFRSILPIDPCIVHSRRFCALGMRILKSGQSSNLHETFLNLNSIVRTRITRYFYPSTISLEENFESSLLFGRQ